MKPLSVDISNDALNIIIGLATLIIALISFGTEIGKYKTFKFLKSLSFRIPVLLIFSIVIIWSTVIKDKNNDIKNSNDVEIRDSINQKKFNESLSKSSNSAAETMAKYYLLYNESQRKIEKLVKDSSTRKITVKNNNLKPIVALCDLTGERILDTIKLVASICSKQSIAYDVKLKSCNVLRINDELQFVNNPYNFNLKHGLTYEGDSFTRTFYYKNLQQLPQVYFYIYGTFKDGDGKIQNVNILNSYSFKLSKILDLTDKEYIWIKDFIRKNGIKII